MKNKGFLESLIAAIDGFIHCLRSQRNMRIHFILAAAVLIGGIYLNLTRMEIMILVATVALVLIAEMINTSIELTLDLLKTEKHPQVKLVKDISAGSVLVAAICTLIVGYILFFERLNLPLESGISKLKQSDWHITLIIMIMLISLVIFSKLIFHRGSPLRGGMPSGHSAFAFSVWTLTLLMQKNAVVSMLVLIMAILIARSRKKERIHTIFEITTGAILGAVVTFFVYQILT